LTYRVESDALDTRILTLVEQWSRTNDALSDAAFDGLALELFDYQLRYNVPYARYCTSLGIGVAEVRSWHDVPPLPASAFKDATIATFDGSRATLTFETSGTTAGRSGRHLFETPALYDAALLATFDRYLLPDGACLRYLNLVPNPAERTQSSLGYMMARVAALRGDGRTGWFVRGDELALDSFIAALREAEAAATPVCIATTAFALAHVIEALEERPHAFALPPGSRLMETGGFKGRTRSVERAGLYDRARQAFGLPLYAIVAEYGMTELTSQYYDDAFVRADEGDVTVRRKFGPPWLRTRVAGPDGRTLPSGTVGSLVHVDLANRASCIAVATEDLGVQFEDDGLLLIGREHGAALRGCSLDAETMKPLRV
jgi:hypothetical protein